MRILGIFMLMFTSINLYSCGKDTTISTSVVKEYNDIKASKFKVPNGMKLVWSDEFNDNALDRSKWSTNYYSTGDFAAKTNYTDFLNDNLPQPGLIFTDSSLIIYTDALTPERPYWSHGRRVSSIQTYDWNKDENLLGNLVGGYVEARLKRTASNDATEVNTAFWLDSPGPDLKYYIEKGNAALGASGIRPKGQPFEIDLCEYLNTEIILHSNVSPNGEWLNTLGQYRVNGIDFKDEWVTHSIFWSPSALKFYVNGLYQTEWSDPKDIKSPNHFMNIYLGAYGNNGKTSMEIDYIRFYQWELEAGNELPNSNFEYSDEIKPWTGLGTISTEKKSSGQQSLKLLPGSEVQQYVYLTHSSDYELSYFSEGDVEVIVDNIEPVNGNTKGSFKSSAISDSFKQSLMGFTTNQEDFVNKSTVKITLRNKGNTVSFIDNIKVAKK